MKKPDKDFFQSTFSKQLGLEKQKTLSGFAYTEKLMKKVDPKIRNIFSKYLTDEGIEEILESIEKTIKQNLK